MELNSTFSKINAIAHKYLTKHGTSFQGPDVQPWHTYFHDEAQRVLLDTNTPLQDDTDEINRIAQQHAAMEQLNRTDPESPEEYYGPDTADPTDPVNYPVLSAFESGEFNSSNATYESVSQLQDELLSQTSALSRKPRKTQHIIANHRIASAIYVKKAIQEQLQREPTQASNPIFPISNPHLGMPTSEIRNDLPTFDEADNPLNPPGTGLRDNPEYTIKRAKINEENEKNEDFLASFRARPAPPPRKKRIPSPTYNSDEENAQDPMAGTIFAGSQHQPPSPTTSTLPRIPTPPQSILRTIVEVPGVISTGIVNELKEAKEKLGNFFHKEPAPFKTPTPLNRTHLLPKLHQKRSKLSRVKEDGGDINLDVRHVISPEVYNDDVGGEPSPSSPDPVIKRETLPNTALGFDPTLRIGYKAVVNKSNFDRVHPQLRKTVNEANQKARTATSDPMRLQQISQKSFGSNGPAAISTVSIPEPNVRVQTPDDFDRNLSPINPSIITTRPLRDNIRPTLPHSRQANDIYRFRQAGRTQIPKESRPDTPGLYNDGDYDDGGFDYDQARQDNHFVPIVVPSHPPLQVGSPITTDPNDPERASTQLEKSNEYGKALVARADFANELANAHAAKAAYKKLAFKHPDLNLTPVQILEQQAPRRQIHKEDPFGPTTKQDTLFWEKKLAEAKALLTAKTSAVAASIQSNSPPQPPNPVQQAIIPVENDPDLDAPWKKVSALKQSYIKLVAENPDLELPSAQEIEKGAPRSLNKGFNAGFVPTSIQDIEYYRKKLSHANVLLEAKTKAIANALKPASKSDNKPTTDPQKAYSSAHNSARLPPGVVPPVISTQAASTTQSVPAASTTQSVPIASTTQTVSTPATHFVPPSGPNLPGLFQDQKKLPKVDGAPLPTISFQNDYPVDKDPLAQARRRRADLAKRLNIISPEGLHRDPIVPQSIPIPDVNETTKFLKDIVKVNDGAKNKSLHDRYVGVRKVQDALANIFNGRAPQTTFVPDKKGSIRAHRMPYPDKDDKLTLPWFLPTSTPISKDDELSIKAIIQNQLDAEDSAHSLYLHAAQQFQGLAARKNYIQRELAAPFVANAYAHSYLAGNDIATLSRSHYLKAFPNDRTKPLSVLPGYLDYHRLARIGQILNGVTPTPFKTK
jgi:hypothetical protein